MDERDRRGQQNERNSRGEYQDSSRQPEQWRDDGTLQSGSNRSNQQGNESGDRDRDQMGGSTSSYSGYSSDRDRYRPSRSDEDRGGARTQRGYGNEPDRYGSGNSGSVRSSYRSSVYDDGSADRFGSFTTEDQGGRDFVSSSRSNYGYGGRSMYGDAGGAGGANYGGARDYAGRGSSQAGNEYGGWREYGEQRGFFERAGDEIASWFGDDDATRRREQDHRGRGPSDYTRSDDRIREDANDSLTHDRFVDATNVTVRVEKGELTLDGTVASRQAKRRAEDAVEHVSGVRHVQNNLRVKDGGSRDDAAQATSSSSGSASSYQTTARSTERSSS